MLQSLAARGWVLGSCPLGQVPHGANTCAIEAHGEIVANKVRQRRAVINDLALEPKTQNNWCGLKCMYATNSTFLKKR